jgi:hypothetical protein
MLPIIKRIVITAEVLNLMVDKRSKNVTTAKNCVSTDKYHDQLRHISVLGNKLLMYNKFLHQYFGQVTSLCSLE